MKTTALQHMYMQLPLAGYLYCTIYTSVTLGPRVTVPQM